MPCASTSWGIGRDGHPEQLECTISRLTNLAAEEAFKFKHAGLSISAVQLDRGIQRSATRPPIAHFAEGVQDLDSADVVMPSLSAQS